MDADAAAVVAALMALPGATPHRMGRLLATASVEAAWRSVIDGRVAAGVADRPVLDGWRAHAATVDLVGLARQLTEAGIVATSWHDPHHPGPFVVDIDPAPLLLRRGRPPSGGTRVAIIGTRRSTAVGREIAYELGAGLAGSGVSVVSGLALGIDGAAHRGALSARGAAPIAVVGSGVDVVYPPRHRELWDEIVEAGTLLSEAPLGGAPEPWRFPARNRMLAALADLVIVVESRQRGGSLLTVEQAIRRDVAVMAVPGSVRNPAAAGTNQLIADGCAPVRDVTDALVALGLSTVSTAAGRGAAEGARPPVEGVAAAVLDAIDDGPTTLDDLVRRSELAVPAVLAALEGLVADGRVATDGARYTRGRA